jgi:hypothetical protein
MPGRRIQDRPVKPLCIGSTTGMMMIDGINQCMINPFGYEGWLLRYDDRLGKPAAHFPDLNRHHVVSPSGDGCLHCLILINEPLQSVVIVC